jgi:lysyl-tRNA synthetase class 2
LQSIAIPFAHERSPRYLHTSAEYAMKRLLAAGSGDIYQLCHVFRGGEQGPHHSMEFCMLEWYRVGLNMQQLMEEVAAFLQQLLPAAMTAPVEYRSYSDCLRPLLDAEVLGASDALIAARAGDLGFDGSLLTRCDRDQLLDLLMATRIGPALGRNGPCFVHHYPASQAVLARLDPSDARVALRFEVYINGMELANGFEELADAAQQRARLEADNRLRSERGMPVVPIDERLLAALASGLPPCSGVALGFDRLLMLAAGASHIDEVLSFPSDRA